MEEMNSRSRDGDQSALVVQDGDKPVMKYVNAYFTTAAPKWPGIERVSRELQTSIEVTVMRMIQQIVRAAILEERTNAWGRTPEDILVKVATELHEQGPLDLHDGIVEVGSPEEAVEYMKKNKLGIAALKMGSIMAVGVELDERLCDKCKAYMGHTLFVAMHNHKKRTPAEVANYAWQAYLKAKAMGLRTCDCPLTEKMIEGYVQQVRDAAANAA